MDSMERKQKKQRDTLRMYAIAKCVPSKEAVDAFRRKPFQLQKREG